MKDKRKMTGVRYDLNEVFKFNFMFGYGKSCECINHTFVRM